MSNIAFVRCNGHLRPITESFCSICFKQFHEHIVEKYDTLNKNYKKNNKNVRDLL